MAKNFGWLMKSATFNVVPPNTMLGWWRSDLWSCSQPKLATPGYLDPDDHLAARVARDGDAEPIHFEETDTNLAIGWKGNYRIDGDAFVYGDWESARVVTILGYPTARIAELG